MMIILTLCLNMEITLHSHAHRLKEVLEHLGWHITHPLAGKKHTLHKVGTTSEVQQYHRLALIHRQHKAVAVNASF